MLSKVVRLEGAFSFQMVFSLIELTAQCHLGQWLIELMFCQHKAWAADMAAAETEHRLGLEQVREAFQGGLELRLARYMSSVGWSRYWWQCLYPMPLGWAQHVPLDLQVETKHHSNLQIQFICITMEI